MIPRGSQFLILEEQELDYIVKKSIFLPLFNILYELIN